ncbi:MFS transporter [Salipiger mangrovisoli]|uniref:MFS transporter n=1 Tax=Salipiger mangrovisoli TaxID=2865933 RepID=A0ABR9WY57_9RHOB|nr:MFS transporter [Salipiger mangrovisoli]MBE9636211.1 MFS transporter [Salipiger mangrovisoli]
MARTGAAALVVGQCAGLVDLGALPVWVGALIAHFGFGPREAGAQVTLFLIGAVLASLLTARNLTRLPRKALTVAGFALPALVFVLATRQSTFLPLAVLHLLGGMANGVALSLVHGTMGRSGKPHRLFAIAGAGLGLFGAIYMGTVPPLLIKHGGAALFLGFGAIMAVAALATLLAFPDARARAAGPAPLAARLERRPPAHRVVMAGPEVQAVLALALTFATAFSVWAPVATVFATVQVFTHTFAFGLLARMDRSGRAAAATPAMLMIGSALDPIVDGVLIEGFSIGALGIMAVLIAGLSVTCFAPGTRGAR